MFSHSRDLRQNQTEAETKLWQNLRAHRCNEIHFRRQHVIGTYFVDFCAPRQKLIIEIDGGQHLEQQEYDKERTAYLESKGYKVLRFWNDEVMKNIEGVVETIMSELRPLPASPKIQSADFRGGNRGDVE